LNDITREKARMHKTQSKRENPHRGSEVITNLRHQIKTPPRGTQNREKANIQKGEEGKTEDLHRKRRGENPCPSSSAEKEKELIREKGRIAVLDTQMKRVRKHCRSQRDA